MEPNPKLKLNLELPTDWSKIKTSSGKSFDDLFHLDNIPLSWIYQRIFLPHVIPKPLTKKYKDENNKLTKLFLRKRRNITAKIIAKYIQYNESRKYIISQKNKEQKNDLQTKIKKCLILTYLNHYENREGVQKIARIQGIIDHLKQYNSRKKNFEKNNLKEDNLSDENLKKDKLETYLIFADRLSSQPTDEKKVKLNTIYNHIDQENITKAQKKAREMYRLWKNIYQKEIETIISEENKSLWDYYNPIFTLYFSKEFLYLTILYYETFKKVIEKENIAVIVTTAQNGLFERCCFAAAKTKNIPTLFIQHGIGTISGKPELFLDNTHLAVFGPNIKKELVKSGINQNKITATGPVVYDEIIKYSKNQKKENKNKENNRSIIITTQPLIEDNLIEKEYYFISLEKVINSCLSLDCTINIKLHPREKHLKEYNKIKELDQNKIKIHIHQNVNHLYELLSKSSLLINFRLSTTILEATILGVPSITIPLVKNMPSFFKDLDPSIHLILNDSLRTEIKNVLEHPNINQQIRDRTIKEFFTKIDGKSSQRATKLILKLANS